MKKQIYSLNNRNKLWQQVLRPLLLVIFILTTFVSFGQTLVGWDFSTLTGGANNWGPSPYTPIQKDPNVTVVGLTRNWTITPSGSAASYTWGANNFSITASTEAAAITANNFVTFSITPSADYQVSISSIAAYNIRRSATGPSTGIWQYQVGSGSFTDIGSSITWGSVTSASGNPQTAIALGGIPALQSVPAGTTITFRLITWGATQIGGTWYFNEPSTHNTGSDLSIIGSVSPLGCITPDAPTVGSNTPVCLGSTISLTASDIVGATYSWTGPNGFTSIAQNPTIPNATSAMAGTYNVTATVGGCASNPASTTVATKSLPFITASNNGPMCEGSSLTVSATTVAGATYNWTGPNSYTSSSQNPNVSSNATIAMAGTYTATATLNGCASLPKTTTVTINASPTQVIVSGGGTQCGGSMTLTATGGSGGTMYWQGTNSGGVSVAFPLSTQAVSSSGTYFFRAQSVNGCWSPEGGAIVTINTSPDPVSVVSDGSHCLSSVLTASGGAGGTINWQGTTSGGTDIGTPTTSYTVTTSGTYYFRAKSSNGCWGQEGSVVVALSAMPDVVMVSGNGVFCGNATLHATGGAGGNIYWQGITPNGINTSYPANSWNVTASGTYYFRSRSTDGCWGPQGSTTVTINTVPDAVTVSLFGTGVNCGSAILVAIGGNNGSIYFQGNTSGGTSQAIHTSSQSISSSGTYYFRAVSPEGCWGQEGSSTLIITPVPEAPTGNPIQYYCEGYSISNIAASGTDIKWYATAVSMDELNAGATLENGAHYFATQTINGCSSSNRLEVEIHIVIPSAPTGADSLWFCATDSPNVGNLTAYGENIQWFENATGGDPLTPSTPLTNNTHYYATQSEYGCASPARLDVTAIVNNTVPIKPIMGGSTSVCVNGTTTAFTDATIEGVWSIISGTGSASITNGGIVTGVSAGTVNVVYTVTIGSCSSFISKLLTINPLPNVNPITGTPNVCIGSTTQLADATLNGIWSISNNNIATISTDGLVSVLLPGTAWVSYTISDINGCVNLATQEVFVNPVYSFIENHTICQGTPFIWHGQNLIETGVYNDNLQTKAGCDSLYTLNLTVFPVTSHNENYSVCEGTPYEWHNQNLTTTGTYTAQEPNANGCLETYTLHFTVNPKYSVIETQSICEGNTYDWHGMSLDISGTYYDTHTTVNGCDSSYTLTLTIHPKYSFNENQSICEGTPFTWHGQTLSTTGVYNDNLQTKAGCDSLYTLNLTVFPVTSHTENYSVCEGTPYEWHNQNLTTSGTYTALEPNANGCLETYTLHFTVNPKYSVTETQSICEGNTYDWHGMSLDASGTYYDTHTTINGCDSSYTLSLTVNPTNTFVTDQSINEGETYLWRGQSYSMTGQYTEYETNGSGCQDTYVLNLTVISSTKTLTVRLFLEGLYSGSGAMRQAKDVGVPKFAAGISDTVRIELHDAVAPHGLAFSYANLDLSTDGNAIINTIPGTITGSYYIVVKHRNSIETWSTDAIDFSVASPISYDFTTSASNAYSSNMKAMNGGVYAIFAGDDNRDGIVDGSDMAAIDNASTAVMTGYHPEDLNGDGIVDASDMAIIDNNSTAVVSAKRP